MAPTDSRLTVENIDRRRLIEKTKDVLYDLPRRQALEETARTTTDDECRMNAEAGLLLYELLDFLNDQEVRIISELTTA